MKSIFQKTLSMPVSFSGIGIHTGLNSSITLKPAPAGYGIGFVIPNHGGHIGRRISFGAHISNVDREYSRASTVVNDTTGGQFACIMTVEHLLAALYFADITNCMIEIHEGIEIPILDGSAWDILKLIYDQNEKTNSHFVPKIVTQMAKTDPLIIDKEYRVEGDNGEWVSFTPADEFWATIDIDFTDRSPKLIGKQSFSFAPEHVTNKVWAQCSIACARTFGFYSDMEKLHRSGIARGAGLENCIVVDDKTDTIMNEFDLYWPDEFVRHKLVDVLGDLMLAGQPIQGHFIGYKPSHRLVHELLRKLPLQN